MLSGTSGGSTQVKWVKDCLYFMVNNDLHKDMLLFSHSVDSMVRLHGFVKESNPMVKVKRPFVK